ncbi:hypothetical protein HGO97_003910 [Faecalicatena sp. AGMB00832]|uniref:YqzL-like protein n=1 Tax=Faecalicatena faecalis TaxID=2726362 RepID=A0ABS6D0B7_9FIRM|nr:hypothetical protein [Faecalicatena faecalis]
MVIKKAAGRILRFTLARQFYFPMIQTRKEVLKEFGDDKELRDTTDPSK